MKLEIEKQLSIIDNIYNNLHNNRSIFLEQSNKEIDFTTRGLLSYDDLLTYISDIISFFNSKKNIDISEKLKPTIVQRIKIMIDILEKYQDLYSNETTVFSHSSSFSLEDILSLLKFLYSLGASTESTVIVGANGSGKSFLTNLFQQDSSIKDSYTIVPAERPLKIHNLNQLKTIGNIKYVPPKETLRNPCDSHISNQNNIFSQLYHDIIENHKNIGMKFFHDSQSTHVQRPNTIFEQVINIWNDIMKGNRTLEIDPDNLYSLLVKGDNITTPYNIYSMSDGEKTLLYLIMAVLNSPKDTFILIDEPEVYLHKAIVNKVWDRLERERSDLQFIYLTHDVDFAVSRSAKKLWIKSFEYPNKWDIQEIEKNDIPQELYLKLLGSRDPILFCEGVISSLDARIYEILFPNFVITPVGPCKEVIDCTKAFNRTIGKNVTAYGIIDKDHRPQQQIDEFKEDNITTLNYSEIENILLIPKVLESFIQHISENITIQQFKEKIFPDFSNNLHKLTSEFVRHYIRFQFTANNSIKGKTKNAIQSSLDKFTSSIDIENIYNSKYNELKKIEKDQDYDSLLRVWNQKYLCNKVGISNYKNRTIQFLKQHGSDLVTELKEIAIDTSIFPAE